MTGCSGISETCSFRSQRVPPRTRILLKTCCVGENAGVDLLERRVEPLLANVAKGGGLVAAERMIVFDDAFIAKVGG